jgi:3-oxoadipate enol-lactonase
MVTGSNGRLFSWQGGEGRELVLIHGMFGDHLDWEPVLEPLSRSFLVTAPDLPGFGASPRNPRHRYDANLFVNAIHGLTGGRRVTLVGNSFGGQVAMFYALAHPESVSALVLVASGGFSRFSPGQQAMLGARTGEDVLLNMRPDVVRALFSPLFVNRTEAVERYLARRQASLAFPDYPAYARVIAASSRLSLDTCLLDDVARLDCPTLLLWGEQDYAVPVALAWDAVNRFPRAQLTVLANCGHVPQIDCPEAFVRAVERFLRTTP